jgi:membrane fusion protein (multidrug efflux system)
VVAVILTACSFIWVAGCSGDESEGEPARSGSRGGPPGGRGRPGGPGGEPAPAAVPVEVSAVAVRSIASYIETNGTLEAENEVDIVARTSGPIVEIAVEETDHVQAGRLLARIDDAELRAQLEISRVDLNEATLAYDRVQKLVHEELISVEEFEQAKARFESAKAQINGIEIQLGYTRILAPFGGLIIERYVKFAEHVSVGQPLFRIADFDPLLCPIQVPERLLSSLRKGQRAYLTVEAWPGERFDARVLRISPVVDSNTGTIKVTLQVDVLGRLRPGMFASVYVETATHEGVRVIPKAALSLDSIGDTVFVATEGTASRRDVKLGFREGDFVEVLEGVEVGEPVIVVGQDGLSNGTQIQILDAPDAFVQRETAPDHERAAAGDERPRGERPEGGRPGGGPRSKRPFDPSTMTTEQLENVKARMRARGMTDEQIEERLVQAARERNNDADPK